MVKANCCTCDENLLLSSTHSLQEGNEGHEAFIVGGLAELLHQGLGLLLGQLLSEVGQHFEQLVGQHGVVVVLVVQLQDLNEVEVDGLDFLLLQTKFSHCYSVVIKGIASQDY